MFYRFSVVARLSAYSLLLLLAALSLSCQKRGMDGAGSSTSSNYSYQPPTPAPTPVDAKIQQYNIQMVDGGKVKFADLVGNNKIVLVNFWATWCPPCRREIPELIELQNQLKDKGFEVVGLTVEDPAEAGERVKYVAQELSINYKIGFSPTEVFELFDGSNPSGLIPQTFIFDGQGKLIDSVKGLRPNFRAWVEGAVNHALNNSRAEL